MNNENKNIDNKDNNFVIKFQQLVEQNSKELEYLPNMTKGEKIVTSILMAILVVIITVFICLNYIITPSFIVGISMQPTVHDGDRVWTSHLHKKPVVGDLICYYAPNPRNGMPEKVLKRVFAVPGQTLFLHIWNDTIYNPETGESATLSTAQSKYLNRFFLGIYGYTLKEKEYFCMGDNRENSHDCRDYGPIKAANIVGIIIKKECFHDMSDE